MKLSDAVKTPEPQGPTLEDRVESLERFQVTLLLAVVGMTAYTDPVLGQELIGHIEGAIGQRNSDDAAGIGG